MASVKRSKALTMTVGTRMDFEEVARIDALARAVHLDRASYIRRVLLGRKVNCHQEELLLAQAVSLFATMRISVELGRGEHLEAAFTRLCIAGIRTSISDKGGMRGGPR